MLRSAACTFSRTGRSYTVQKWYNCETCDMRDSRGCCEPCALDCHAGHALKLAGTSPFFCDCGADSLCKRCTFDVTGKKYRKQAWYVCETCGLLPPQGCCKACVETCHAGHFVRLQSMSAAFYCDCGALSFCAQLRAIQDAKACTYSVTGTSYRVQPWFNCLTCGLIDDAGVCKYCMESHHIGHELVAKPAKLFYCDCGARSLCESLEAPIAPVSIVPPAGGSSTPLDPSVDDTTLCCICVDAAKDTLLSHGDHGHLCVCFPCGKSLEARGSACPVCRQVILAVTKVYA